MSRPPVDDDLTFILGPPTDPGLRRAFDDYQSAVAERREPEARRYQALEREYLEEIFVGQGGDEGSAFEEVLGAALGTPVRVRRVGIDVAMMKGLWVVAVAMRRGDVEFEPGAAAVPFPPDRDTCEALSASLGLLPGRDWCVWFTPNRARPGRVPGSDARATSRRSRT